MQLSKCFCEYRVRSKIPTTLTYLHDLHIQYPQDLSSPSHASAAASDKYAAYFLQKEKDSEFEYSRRSTQEKKCMLPVHQNGGQKSCVC
jgi:hypothetical protein